MFRQAVRRAWISMCFMGLELLDLCLELFGLCLIFFSNIKRSLIVVWIFTCLILLELPVLAQIFFVLVKTKFTASFA